MVMTVRILTCEKCGHMGQDVSEQPTYSHGHDTTAYLCNDYNSCFARVGNWQPENHKGSKCVCQPMTCSEGICQNCSIWHEYIQGLINK